MKSTSAAQVIIHALWPGPGPATFEVTDKPVSASRAELFTYASRSATRCSSDGEGEGVCAYSGEKNAMTPIRKRTRLITRSGYSARIYHGKENAVIVNSSAEDSGRYSSGRKKNSAERLARPG
jgi:hypothetical protein